MDKAHILGEIKRLANSNGGKAPGKEAFRRQSGIRETDWLRHWPKWGDALVEAGFIPNKLNVAYNDDFLIIKLIELTRELGHFPSYNEIRFKSYNDKEFPNRNTFSRLGKITETAKKVREYCQNDEQYSDVLQILPENRQHFASSPEDTQATRRNKASDDGYVYLSKSGRYHKIGRTNALGRREYELGIQLPEKIATVHSIRTDDPVGIEKYWHARFQEKRKNGEWFELTADDVRAFKRRSFM